MTLNSFTLEEYSLFKYIPICIGLPILSWVHLSNIMYKVLWPIGSWYFVLKNAIFTLLRSRKKVRWNRTTLHHLKVAVDYYLIVGFLGKQSHPTLPSKRSKHHVIKMVLATNRDDNPDPICDLGAFAPSRSSSSSWSKVEAPPSAKSPKYWTSKLAKQGRIHVLLIIWYHIPWHRF